MRDHSDDTRAASAPRSATAWMIWIAVLVAVAHAATLWGTGPVDDDYIVYRYARNWIAGEGIVFNVGGEPTEGSTSPLWFLACALGVRVGAAPELWSPAIGLVATGVLTLAVGRAGMRLVHGPMGSLPAWLVALSPAVAWHANAGLGTVPLAAAIAVGVERWSAWTRGGSARALAAGGVAFAVACALRAEAALVWITWLVCARGSVRGARWGWALLPACVLVVVTAFRWSTFGAVLPHAFHMKSLPLIAEFEHGARYLLRSTTEGGVAVLLLLGCVVPRGDHEGDRCSRAVGVAAILALVQVFVVGGDWMVYGRFLVPYVALGALAGVLALGDIARPALRASGAGALVALTIAGLVARPQAAFESRFFEAWWLEVGDAFQERAPAGSSVAISPIGAFGWRSELPIVDVLGLTHDALIEVEPDLESTSMKGHHRHDGAWVLDQSPAFIVLGNGVIQPGKRTLDVNPWEADIVRDPRFARGYSPFELELRRADGRLQTLPYYVREDVQPLR